MIVFLFLLGTLEATHSDFILFLLVMCNIYLMDKPLHINYQLNSLSILLVLAAFFSNNQGAHAWHGRVQPKGAEPQCTDHKPPLASLKIN